MGCPGDQGESIHRIDQSAYGVEKIGLDRILRRPRQRISSIFHPVTATDPSDAKRNPELCVLIGKVCRLTFVLINEPLLPVNADLPASALPAPRGAVITILSDRCSEVSPRSSAIRTDLNHTSIPVAFGIDPMPETKFQWYGSPSCMNL